MASEPEDLTLRYLREMRETLAELKQGQQKHDHSIESLRKEIHDWQETTATTTGFAMHANVRNRRLEEEIASLTRRVEALEHAR